MKIDPEVKRRLFAIPGVTRVGWGLKRVAETTTTTPCIVVGVRRKLPSEDIPPRDRVPAVIDGYPTDVVEDGEIKTRDTEGLGPSAADMPLSLPQSLTQRQRPCPGGFSIGHRAITAGTLGVVTRHASGALVILSNNHVLANSNAATEGDDIYQPGPHDGGGPNDLIADLLSFARIRFEEEQDGGGGGGGDLGCAGQVLSWFPGMGRIVRAAAARASGMVEQPYPNRVDAALALPFANENVTEGYIFGLGHVGAMRDPALGALVRKAGRTTEITYGQVEAVDNMVRVSYGTGKTAAFDGQVVVRGLNGVEFSQPGDSGSLVLHENGDAAGLLFAGGSGTTIVNLISDVQRYMQIA